jgi:hypothetical protein
MNIYDGTRYDRIHAAPGREYEFLMAKTIIESLRIWDELQGVLSTCTKWSLCGTRYGITRRKLATVVKDERRELAKYFLSEDFTDDCLDLFHVHPEKILSWAGIEKEQLREAL